MKLRVWRASITALVSLTAAGTIAGTNTWTETGPNAVSAVVRYSGNSSIAYARGGDKLWRSSDAGATWVMKSEGNSSEHAFAVHPVDANLIVMQSSWLSLLRSVDGGDTFTNPYAPQFRARVLKFGGASPRLYAVMDFQPYVRYSDNNGTTWTSTTDNGLPPFPTGGGVIPMPNDIAIHPLDPAILFVAYRHTGSSGIFRTTDGGANWTPGAGMLDVFVNSIEIDPATPARIFAATDNGLYVSQDGGDSWARAADPTGTGVATRPLSVVAFDRLDPTIVHAGGARRGELFRGANNGTSWTRRDAGILATRILSIEPRPGTAGEMLVGTSHTIYRTTNAGQSWSNSAGGIRSFFVSVLQNGSRLRAALSDGGIYESLDGSSWTPMNNASLRDSLRDGEFATIRGIAETDKLFVMLEGTGEMVVSDNGGNTWQKPPTFNYLRNGLAGGFVTERGTGSPHYATSYSGVDKSFDDGVTWSQYNSGLPVPALTTKIVKNADASALYVGTFHQGMYKSTNGGSSWTAINNGLPASSYISSLAYDEANDVLVVGANQGVYVSRNGGSSFTALSSPTLPPGVQASIATLLVEDFDHGAIYVGMWRNVFRSVDQGATWTELTAGAPALPPASSSFVHLQDLVGDGPGVLYAGYSWVGLRAFTVSPDIRLTSTAPTAGNYNVGTQLPWSVTVTNDGPHASTFSHFTWSLPSNVSVSNVSSSRGSCSVSQGRVLNCDLGVLQPAQTATIDMTITGVSGGTVHIDASAGGAEIDSQPGNNRFTNSGVRFVERVDVSATLEAAGATVDSGATVTYTLTVRNDGPDAVSGASFESTFDSRDQYVLNQGSLAGCTGTSAGTLNCPLASLASGESRVWRWVVTTIPSGARAPSAAVRVNADNSVDSNPANNSDTEALTVIAVNDMSLTMLGSAANVSRGQPVSYTLTATNLGVISAPGVSATLTLPTALQYQGSSGSCSATGNLVTCDLGALNPGAMSALTVTLNTIAAGTSNVSAQVASANPDRSAANNTASATLDIAPVGNLGVTLTSSVATVETNAAFSYALTVSNSAGSDAAAATVRVTLSNLLSYTSASGATCTASAGVVSCTLGALAAGASTVVTINVTGASAGSAASRAEVTSAILESDTTNNAADAAAVTVTSPPPPPPPPPPPAPPTPAPQPSSGGGGGGAFDYLSACLLTGMLGMALRTRRRRI